MRPGDRIPGLPQPRFKAEVDYWITIVEVRWDMLAVSNQYFSQDDSNLNGPLGGYGTVDLHTRYDNTDRIQIFGLVNTVFDQEYGVSGTSAIWMPATPVRLRIRSLGTTSSPTPAPSRRSRRWWPMAA